MTVYGQGFQPLGPHISFSVQTSLSSLEPQDWTSTDNRTFPIHVQLEKNIYSTKPRYIDVNLPYSMIITGLDIETWRYVNNKKCSIRTHVNIIEVQIKLIAVINNFYNYFFIAIRLLVFVDVLVDSQCNIPLGQALHFQVIH